MYALIKNGIVENVIVADASFIASITPEWSNIVEVANTGAGIGWTYANGAFTAPEVVIPPVVAEPRHISVGAFFDRFGDQKYPILASSDASVKALIQDTAVRKYIDLDNAQLPYGLAMLVAAGFTIDPTAIISAEITPAEKP